MASRQNNIDEPTNCPFTISGYEPDSALDHVCMIIIISIPDESDELGIVDDDDGSSYISLGYIETSHC